MTNAKDFLCFSGPRRFLYNGDQFVTAMDCAEGDWGFAQQYWAQDPSGKWYPNENGVVLVQVIFRKVGDSWHIAAENEFALDSSGKLYKKYSLVYPECPFCAVAFKDFSIKQYSGIAQWTQFDERSNVVHGPTPVMWSYAVSMEAKGNLDEAYQQGASNQLAYWKHTEMKVGRGDVVLTDLLTGTTCRQKED
jgi:hypothetical protein